MALFIGVCLMMTSDSSDASWILHSSQYHKYKMSKISLKKYQRRNKTLTLFNVALLKITLPVFPHFPKAKTSAPTRKSSTGAKIVFMYLNYGNQHRRRA